MQDELAHELLAAAAVKASSVIAKLEDDLAAITKMHYDLTNRVGTLFKAIKHGDRCHQLWLEKAIADHFAGLPVKPKAFDPFER